MKKLFFIILLSSQVFGQSNPNLYIAALKGLSLRESPSKESKRIKLLSYGTMIASYVIPEGKTVTIDGYPGKWIDIPTQDGKSTYVFDGYTLPFKVPQKENFMRYLIGTFGNIVLHDSVVKTNMEADYELKHTYTFSSGVVYKDASYYEAYEGTLENLDLSVQKAYLFYFLIEENIFGGYHLLNKIDFPTLSSESDTLSIQLNQKDRDLFIERINGGTSYLIITRKNGKVNICWGGYV
jgi:hypothetical protein